MRLYEDDRKPGVGLCLLTKLKFEHIRLNSFSKMRADLATQVRDKINACVLSLAMVDIM